MAARHAPVILVILVILDSCDSCRTFAACSKSTTAAEPCCGLLALGTCNASWASAESAVSACAGLHLRRSTLRHLCCALVRLTCRGSRYARQLHDRYAALCSCGCSLGSAAGSEQQDGLDALPLLRLRWTNIGGPRGCVCGKREFCSLSAVREQGGTRSTDVQSGACCRTFPQSYPPPSGYEPSDVRDTVAVHGAFRVAHRQRTVPG